MTLTLTTRERAHLKGRAHPLEPVVHVGTAGVTDAVIAELERALTAHELLKVRIGSNDRQARVSIGDELCAKTGAAAVDRVGKVLILWRPRPIDPEDAPTVDAPTKTTAQPGPAKKEPGGRASAKQPAIRPATKRPSKRPSKRAATKRAATRGVASRTSRPKRRG